MVLCHKCYIYATCKSKEVRMGEVLKPSYGWATNFYGMELTRQDIMFTIFRLVIALLLTDDVNYYMHLLLVVSNAFSISLKNSQKFY